MNVLSLFDGISCGMVALERVGIKVDKYVAYEIDENAIKVSKHNYPHIEHMGDVFKAEYSLEEYDLLIGGSPCTYWSIAKGNGRETTSSGFGYELFMQYARALKEVKPKYFLYENNKSMSDDIKNAITKELGVEPVMINSENFSAQQRKRYYWTNIPFDKNLPKCELLIKDIFLPNSECPIKTYEQYRDSMIIRNNGKSVAWDTSRKGYYSQTSRARGLWMKMNTITTWDDCNNIWLGGFKYRHIDAIEAERCQTLPDNYTKILDKTSERIKAVGNGWTVDVIAHILSGLKDSRDGGKE